MASSREIERIVDQLRRAHEGSAWSGPSVSEALRGVSAAAARARPLAAVHTIWEIAGHIAAWDDVVRRRIGGQRSAPGPGENFPKPGTGSAAEWKALVASVRERNRKLREAVQALSEDELDRAPHEGASPVYVQLHGAAQHALYHAGQIVLLKKAAKAAARAVDSRKAGLMATKRGSGRPLSVKPRSRRGRSGR
jgi:uncharacterized damage-inducible protein DinB